MTACDPRAHEDPPATRGPQALDRRDLAACGFGTAADAGLARRRYQAFASYGSTSESQLYSGQVNVLNFRSVMDAVPDLDDVNGNGNRTEAISCDAIARAQACQPLHLFIELIQSTQRNYS